MKLIKQALKKTILYREKRGKDNYVKKNKNELSFHKQNFY